MLFICHEELLILFLKSNCTVKLRCAFTFAFFLIDLVVGIMVMYDLISYSWNMYARICFAVISTSYLRNACKKMGWTIIKSYSAIFMYLMIFGIYSCIVYISVCGTTKLGYYNTEKNDAFYSYNLTSFPKILMSLFT